MIFFLILCLLLSNASSTLCPPQHPFRAFDDNQSNSPFDASFDEFVNQTLSNWRVPGLSVAVIDGDKVYSKGYGVATFPSTPVTSDTLFFTGSTTKAFVAAALAQLVQDNTNYPHVRWATPVSDLIRDDFVLADEYATARSTIEDALSHRSGLPRHDLAYGHVNDSPKSIVRNMRYLPLTAEPRTTYQYCNPHVRSNDPPPRDSYQIEPRRSPPRPYLVIVRDEVNLLLDKIRSRTRTRHCSQ